MISMYVSKTLKYIYIYKDRLVGLGVSMSDYWSGGRGLDSTNLKCGLGLEGVHSASWGWVVADLIKKFDIIRLDRA